MAYPIKEGDGEDLRLKDALLLFFFGIEMVQPEFDHRELKVLNHIKRGRSIPTAKGLQEATGFSPRTIFRILDRLIQVGAVEKRGHGYAVGGQGVLKRLNPVTRYEGIFFALGLIYILLGFYLGNTPLGMAGIFTMLIARSVRFLSVPNRAAH